jgi:hypothetical protein
MDNFYGPGGYGMPNPTLQQYFNQYGVRRFGILKVHGTEGLNALRMMPNDEVLALDETAPILWVVKTDSAGYKTPTPFEIRPYQPEPEVSLKDIDQRLRRMEDAFYAAKPSAGTPAGADEPAAKSTK